MLEEEVFKPLQNQIIKKCIHNILPVFSINSGGRN